MDIVAQNHTSEASPVCSMYSFQAQGHDLFCFYEKLRKEKEEQKQWDILILVTRKGFWMYQLLLDGRVDTEKLIPGKEVFTDRYLMKTLNRELFRNKRICLMDDTLSNGYSLFRYYCILKREGAVLISPRVYALSTEFPRDRLQKEMKEIYKEIFPGEDDEKAEDAYKDFAGSLRCYRYMSQGKISRFCLREVEFFQEKLCPMVVNLPMMVGKPDGGKIAGDIFLLDTDLFAKLTAGNANWRYHQNVYGHGNQDAVPYRVAGYLNCDIQCNYFEYTDSVVEALKQSVLQSMVVKCKYNIDSEGYYHIVFTPFVIVRSLEKTELKEMFQCLLQGTEYGRLLMDGLEENQGSEFLWTAAMRSVIYVLSLYAGEKFREYLGKLGITEVGYDFDIMQYNSDPEFIRAVREINAVQRVSELCETHILADRRHCLPYKPGTSPTMTEIYEVIHWNIAMPSEDNYNDGNDGTDLDIEGIEKILADRFSFMSEEELSNAVTSIILLMLEISVFGNHIRVRDKQVWRGFRHGENTRILLPKSGRLCYVCAEALFITMKEQGYHDNLSEFLKSMNEYMEETGFFTESCDRENFNQYCNWFIKTSNDARFQILGKECLIDKLDEDESELHEYAIYFAEKHEMQREESKSGDE